MVVLESPQGRRGRVSEGAPPSCPRGLCKLRWISRALGKGYLTGARHCASATLRPSVQTNWSRHTKEPLRQFKVGSQIEMSIISLAGSFLWLSEGEFSFDLLSLQQEG